MMDRHTKRVRERERGGEISDRRGKSKLHANMKDADKHAKQNKTHDDH